MSRRWGSFGVLGAALLAASPLAGDQAVGVAIPSELLLLADQVIE